MMDPQHLAALRAAHDQIVDTIQQAWTRVDEHRRKSEESSQLVELGLLDAHLTQALSELSSTRDAAAQAVQELVRLAVINRGMSARSVAELIGVSHTTVARWL